MFLNRLNSYKGLSGGLKMKIIIEVENDIELMPIEKENLTAFVRRLGFKIVEISEEIDE